MVSSASQQIGHRLYAPKTESKHLRIVARRLKLSFLKLALHRRTAGFLVAGLIGIHVVAWTCVLVLAKRVEGPNSDSLEGYAWGRLLLWGYGKHPPLSGWLARAWFTVFPTQDWALYALAMAVTGAAALAVWFVAMKVVDRRRALLAVLALLIYPMFTFRGSRYDPDLLQLPLFALVMLAFLAAFQARTLASGLILGVVAAAAVLTKYWALLMVGAVGVAALAHPERAKFFRSPAPWAATAAFAVALVPHLIWLVHSDYAPIEYASKHFIPRSYSPLVQTAHELRHHAALLLPVIVVLVWAVRPSFLRSPVRAAGVRLSAARHVWVVTAILVVLPPVLAVAIGVYFAVDWGTPLYLFVPLALLAYPRGVITRRAVLRMGAAWMVTVLVGLIAAPFVPYYETHYQPTRIGWDTRDLALKVTRLWHERFQTPLPVVAGPKVFTAAISFYSPDHPILFTDFNPRIATWIDGRKLRQTGYVSVCYVGFTVCTAMARAIAPAAETIDAGPALDRLGRQTRWHWQLFVVPPQPALGAPAPLDEP